MKMKKILKIQKNKIYFENDDEIIDISPEIKRQFALKAGDDITLKYNEICYEKIKQKKKKKIS